MHNVFTSCYLENTTSEQENINIGGKTTSSASAFPNIRLLTIFSVYEVVLAYSDMQHIILRIRITAGISRQRKEL